MAYSPYNPYINPYYQSPVIPQQQQIPQPQPAPQQTNNGLIWVSGEIGAKSYLMAPGSTVMLMDSESSRFYIKSTDSAGMPSIKTYEYKECIYNAPQAISSNENNMTEQFVTREEYKAICGKYEELKSALEDMQKKPARAKKEAENE